MFPARTIPAKKLVTCTNKRNYRKGSPGAIEENGRPVDITLYIRTAQMLSGMTILLVEDDPDTLVLTKLILTQCHADVLEAGGAVEGLKQLLMHKPDVIVSDIGMPHMNGYEFIQEVRNLPPHIGGQVPALALSAFTRSEDRTRALNAGFQKYLSKPVDIKTLRDAIVNITGR